MLYPVLATVLVLLQAAVPEPADASRPDPTWIAGLYDTADYEEIVPPVDDTSMADRLQEPAATAPLVVVAFVGEGLTSPVALIALQAVRPRSPPRT